MNVLFVCLGNICRSPIAEALLKKKYAKLGIESEVGSAGFEPYLINKPPDEKAAKTAQIYGVTLEGSSRLFVKDDFDRFDKIYTMDSQNYHDVVELARKKSDIDKVELLMNTIDPGKNKTLPDPYHSGTDNCRTVFELIDKATDVIVEIAKEKDNE